MQGKTSNIKYSAGCRKKIIQTDYLIFKIGLSFYKFVIILYIYINVNNNQIENLKCTNVFVFCIMHNLLKKEYLIIIIRGHVIINIIIIMWLFMWVFIQNNVVVVCRSIFNIMKYILIYIIVKYKIVLHFLYNLKFGLITETRVLIFNYKNPNYLTFIANTIMVHTWRVIAIDDNINDY